MTKQRCRHDILENCPDCMRDEMENYRLALAWIKDQSTDEHSRELAATALLAGDQSAPTIDNIPSCGQENDYRRAQSSANGDKP